MNFTSYPKVKTLSELLTWSHYVELILTVTDMGCVLNFPHCNLISFQKKSVMNTDQAGGRPANCGHDNSFFQTSLHPPEKTQGDALR